jgi:hypothetical protein
MAKTSAASTAAKVVKAKETKPAVAEGKRKPLAGKPAVTPVVKPAVKAVKAVKAAVAVKAAAKPAARATPKPALKTVAKPAPAPAARKTAAPAKAAQDAARKLAAPKTRARAAALDAPRAEAPRPQLVRDSFTMPEGEYAVLGSVKQACLKAGFEVKKSELLRIGVALLGQLDTASLRAVLAGLPQLKTGRPAGE